MKSYLVLFLLIGLIPQTKASVRYIPNSGKIKIEVRCEDGLDEHHISYMDERGKTKILELKGNGNEYFKTPELHPTNIYVSRGYFCSQRQMSRKEADAYIKKALDYCTKEKKEKGCKGWD